MLLSVYKKTLLFCLFSLFFNFTYSQTTVPFSVRYQTFVKGDMAIIANNITDKASKNSALNSFMTTFKKPRHNDEFHMAYIDIDNDKNTFSSSSATLELENQSSKKIIFAGLYWSGTYKYNSGYMLKEGSFAAEDNTREAFDKVKIKLPNQQNYTDITGTLVFDGIKEKKFKENAPYALYADITKEVTELVNPFGEYTIANVKATIGTISGGVAAGWSMVFIYEDTQMNGKYITLTDGFSRVYDKSVDINFSGFKTLPQGNVKASVALGVLEGDGNLFGDQLYFKTNKTRIFTPLWNILRKENNFFNSTITTNNDYFINRNPNNKNTLGFDVCSINIPNSENILIGNNCNEAEIRLKSSGDRCFLFFAAFNVETLIPETTINPIENKDLITIQNTNKPLEVPSVVNENPIPVKVEEVVSIPETKNVEVATNQVKDTPIKVEEVVTNQIINTPIKDEEVIVATTENKKVEIASNQVQDTPIKVEETVAKVETKKADTNESTKQLLFSKDQDVFNYNIDGLKQGYYIIANVFAKERNRFNFIKFLKSKGLHPASFYNPIKKYHYVYLEKSENKDEIVSLYNTKLNDSYRQEIWILAVNKTNPNEAVANNSNNDNAKTKTTIAAIVNVDNSILNQNNNKNQPKQYFSMSYVSDMQRRKYLLS